MSFPVEPGAGELDERGLFLVQAPEIRARVLPLFSFDPSRSNDRPVGHGTTFRIDPWSRCLTAFHVLEDIFEVDEAGTGTMLRPGPRLAALEIEGTGFGLVGLRADAWRPLAGSYALCGVEVPPFQTPRLRNLTELVVLRIRPATQPSEALRTGRSICGGGGLCAASACSHSASRTSMLKRAARNDRSPNTCMGPSVRSRTWSRRTAHAAAPGR